MRVFNCCFSFSVLNNYTLGNRIVPSSCTSKDTEIYMQANLCRFHVPTRVVFFHCLHFNDCITFLLSQVTFNYFFLSFKDNHLVEMCRPAVLLYLYECIKREASLAISILLPFDVVSMMSLWTKHSELHFLLTQMT